MNEGSKRPIVIVAACVLLDREGAVLIAKRPQGRSLAGLWEFPGGKVEAGEEPEDALMRELHEELGIDIAKSDLAPLTFASHAYPNFHLLMPLYLCRKWQGSIAAHEGQELLWVKPDSLRQYDMPPADEPLKRALPKLLPAARRIAGDDAGASAVEYALLLAVIALVIAGLVFEIGETLSGMLESVNKFFN